MINKKFSSSLSFPTPVVMEACMLMADDMMDGSVTRRGNPCWYRRGIEQQTTTKQKFKFLKNVPKCS